MRFRRPGGRRAKLTLGPVDLSGKEAGEPKIGSPLTLPAARILASEIGRQRAQDVDVVADLRVSKQRRQIAIKERGTNAFAAAARDFIDDYTVRKTGQKPRRWREDARMLGLDYALAGGDTPIWKLESCVPLSIMWCASIQTIRSHDQAHERADDRAVSFGSPGTMRGGRPT
jgi:hypothetical protein